MYESNETFLEESPERVFLVLLIKPASRLVGDTFLLFSLREESEMCKSVERRGPKRGNNGKELRTDTSDLWVAGGQVMDRSPSDESRLLGAVLPLLMLLILGWRQPMYDTVLSDELVTRPDRPSFVTGDGLDARDEG